MSNLRVFLFGGVRILHDSWPQGIKLTPTLQSLLAYLLLNRHRCHPRDVIATLFWGDQPDQRARNCLSTAMWRLRRVLEPDGVPQGTYLLSNPSGEVGFNSDSFVWLDVADFQSRASVLIERPLNQLTDADIEAGADAISLYNGDLLDGIYDDWALAERERLRTLYLSTLETLMHHYAEKGDIHHSLSFAQKILAYDVLREEIHRKLMYLYIQSGKRALAVRQYELCRQLLARELGVDPLPETQALYRQAVSAITPEAAPALTNVVVTATTADPASLLSILNGISQALVAIDSAQAHLRHATEMLEHLALPHDKH